MMAVLLRVLLAGPLEIEPGVPCVSAERVAPKVEPSGLRVSVKRSGAALQVSGLRSDRRRWSREIPLDDDCVAVKRAIVVLVSTWSAERALPSVEVPAQQPLPPPVVVHHAPVVKPPAKAAPVPVPVPVVVAEPCESKRR